MVMHTCAYAYVLKLTMCMSLPNVSSDILKFQQQQEGKFHSIQPRRIGYPTLNNYLFFFASCKRFEENYGSNN